jgi:hypothetical protein
VRIRRQRRSGSSRTAAECGQLRGFHLNSSLCRRPKCGPVTDISCRAAYAVYETLDGPLQSIGGAAIRSVTAMISGITHGHNESSKSGIPTFPCFGPTFTTPRKIQCVRSPLRTAMPNIDQGRWRPSHLSLPRLPKSPLFAKIPQTGIVGDDHMMMWDTDSDGLPAFCSKWIVLHVGSRKK